METITVQVPEGKIAEQSTDSCGNITIKFIEKEDKNPFKKGLDNNTITDLNSFCERAFGHSNVIHLTCGSQPKGREDLRNRSLIICYYNVVLHHVDNATIIEFIKK